MTSADSIYAMTKVPGDPGSITRSAEACGAVASAAHEAARLLRRIDTSWGSAMWCGPLAAAFRERVTELPPDLDRLTSSYDEVSRALAHYANCLARTQDDLKRHRSIALCELDRANAARAQARSQRVGLDDMVRAMRSIADSVAEQPTEESLREAFRRAQRSYEQRCERFDAAVVGATDAQADLDRALGVIAQMRAELDDERRHCVSQIRYASSIGIKNRPAWRVAVDAVAGAAKVAIKAGIEAAAYLLDKLGTLAAWISVAALAVAVFVPITAKVTLPIAAIAGLVSSATTLMRGGLGLLADVLNVYWGAGYIRVERPSGVDYVLAIVGLATLGVGGVAKPAAELVRKFRVFGPFAGKLAENAVLGRVITNTVRPVFRQLTLWEAAPRAIDRGLAWADRIRRTIVTGWRAGLNVEVRNAIPDAINDVVVPTVQRIRDAFASDPREVQQQVPALQPSCSALPRFAPVSSGWTVLQGAAA